MLANEVALYCSAANLLAGFEPTVPLDIEGQKVTRDKIESVAAISGFIALWLVGFGVLAYFALKSAPMGGRRGYWVAAPLCVIAAYVVAPIVEGFLLRKHGHE